MKNYSIIGICGQLGSGKDTVADSFVNNGYTKVSLADSIKRFARDLFDFSEQQLWGPSEYRNETDPRYYHRSVEWDNVLVRLHDTDTILEWLSTLCPQEDEAGIVSLYKTLYDWCEKLRKDYPELSPRIALQTLGTEWGRDLIDKDIWIRYLYNTAKTLTEFEDFGYSAQLGLYTSSIEEKETVGVVIPDVRFKNELSFLSNKDCPVIRVIRPETDAIADTVGVSGHASETEQKDITDDMFDVILMNTGTLEDLKRNTEVIVQSFEVTK